jgi:hypothetical protein
MSEGGSVWIQEAVDRMKKNKKEGAFTKQSLRKGLTPVEFAQEVLENPSNYRITTRRRAQFVKNANPDKF